MVPPAPEEGSPDHKLPGAPGIPGAHFKKRPPNQYQSSYPPPSLPSSVHRIDQAAAAIESDIDRLLHPDNGDEFAPNPTGAVQKYLAKKLSQADEPEADIMIGELANYVKTHPDYEDFQLMVRSKSDELIILPGILIAIEEQIEAEINKLISIDPEKISIITVVVFAMQQLALNELEQLVYAILIKRKEGSTLEQIIEDLLS